MAQISSVMRAISRAENPFVGTEQVKKPVCSW